METSAEKTLLEISTEKLLEARLLRHARTHTNSHIYWLHLMLLLCFVKQTLLPLMKNTKLSSYLMLDLSQFQSKFKANFYINVFTAVCKGKDGQTQKALISM